MDKSYSSKREFRLTNERGGGTAVSNESGDFPVIALVSQTSHLKLNENGTLQGSKKYHQRGLIHVFLRFQFL